MPRPVEGFLTSDGSFFDTQEQAEAYEAALALHEAMRSSYLVHHYNLSGSTLDFLIDQIIQFLNENATIVTRYLASKQPKPDDTPSPSDGLDWPLGDNPDQESEPESIPDRTDTPEQDDAGEPEPSPEGHDDPPALDAPGRKLKRKRGKSRTHGVDRRTTTSET